VVNVAITLVTNGALSIGAVVLLSTREIGELPLVTWLALNDRARGARAEQPEANVPGKIATCLQFAAVSAALFRAPRSDAWVAAAAIAGAFAAYTYWKCAFEIARRMS
jgi:CDP-diacylglycerol--glycerol-3-phosphate 3-phosphatidyltransferase/cardiolipin synthase